MVSLVNDTFPTGLAHTHSHTCAHVRVFGYVVHSSTPGQDIGNMSFEALYVDDTR